jgi:serine/threonine-protein kinase haspin
MLGTRTKQIHSYGRRNQRIINDRHDLFDVEDTKTSLRPGGRGELGRTATPPSRRGHESGKKLEVVLSPSSTVSPPIPSHSHPKKRRENDNAYSSLNRHPSGSGRRPLSSHSVNVSRRASPWGSKKMAILSGSPRTHLPQSPAVDVDIIVLDDTGRRVSQERRVSNTNIQMNNRTVLAPNMTLCDSDEDDGPLPQFKRRTKRWPKVMSSSDEEDVTSCLTSPRPKTNGDNSTETPVVVDLPDPVPHHSSHLCSPKYPKLHFWVEVPSPRPPGLSRGQLTHYDSPLKPSRGKNRQLTPIRRKGPAFLRPSPSPLNTTDLDISLDLADLTLSSTTVENHSLPDQPTHLIPLLDECGQDAPVEFSAFIEAFPVHPVVWSSYSGHAAFQKIGEASYSEVFGIGDVVLKIIPIRNEECPDRIDVETPAPSDAKDVLQEIIVTRALGEMCNGFVNLLKTYVVRGRYPSLLLDLWDEYNQTKGSESVRPGAAPHVSTPQPRPELAQTCWPCPRCTL